MLFFHVTMNLLHLFYDPQGLAFHIWIANYDNRGKRRYLEEDIIGNCGWACIFRRLCSGFILLNILLYLFNTFINYFLKTVSLKFQ